MNSFGNTVLRRGGRKGASGGEQGQGKDVFTSGREANASADSEKKKRKDKRNTRDSEVSMEDAFAALRATREPFISDESVIAKADDLTVKFESSSSSDVELIMEELPPTRVQPGTLIGHRGWIIGDEAEEGEGVEGDEVEEEGKEGKPGSQRNGRGLVDVKKAQSVSKKGAGSAKVKAGRQKDDFALSESEREAGGSGDDQDPGGGAEAKSPSASARAKRRTRVGRAAGGKAGQQGQGRDLALDHSVASGGTPEVRSGLMARPPRSDLKAGRKEVVKQAKADGRREGGARKQAQEFDDWVEAIRHHDPYEPAPGQLVFWSRSSVTKALGAVEVTGERWQASSEEEQQDLYRAAVAWLEANKPKCSFAQGRYRVTEAVRGSPGLSRADVSGDVDSGGASEQQAERNARDASEGEGQRQQEELGPRGTGEESEGQRGGGGGNATDGAARLEGEDSGSDGPPAKRANTSSEGKLHRSTRAENRAQQQEERRAARRAGRESLGRSQSVTPRALGRSKQAELEKHKRLTRKRERAKRDVQDLIEASLCQQRRQKKGKKLTAEERTLADFASTLSPTKLLGAGFRLSNEGNDPGADEDDALQELMEETGCDEELAKEALDLSCEWTGSGRPSRLKAAQWLMSQKDGDGEGDSKGNRGASSDSDVEFISHRTPGGTTRTPSGGKASGGAPGGHGRDDRRDEKDGKVADAKVREENQKSVSKKASRKSGGNGPPSESESSEGSDEGDSSSDGSLSESLSSAFSSGSEGSDSSDSEGGRSSSRAAKKRDSRGLETPSQRVSRTSEAKRATRYVRQLELALRIDVSWAREIYEECAAQGTTSYDGLLRYFYRREVQHAKGTQRETTRALGGEQQRSPAAGGEFNVSMPTFQLPEWGSGQPPSGGVHFSTLQKMLEAYEKYDKQTNFKTQVTFKSMVNHLLKPNFESKCKLPETVWLPPREDDWMRIAEGKPERGGWSDMRFLKRVRRVLRPKGRTNYEIAFEGLTLRHKGNEEQLAVNLDLWGTKWLAKEKEAADEGKALPALKMKSYFKKAVAGVPRFRRWLEGRTFVSCKDWYGVLCRKLHKTLGQHAEAAYDKEREGEHRKHGGYGRGGGAYRGGYGGSGGGAARGGGAYRGGRGGGATDATTGTTRPSRWGGTSEGKFSDADSGARVNAHTQGWGFHRTAEGWRRCIPSARSSCGEALEAIEELYGGCGGVVLLGVGPTVRSTAGRKRLRRSCRKDLDGMTAKWRA
jgi:hypothetical protein